MPEGCRGTDRRPTSRLSAALRREMLLRRALVATRAPARAALARTGAPRICALPIHARGLAYNGASRGWAMLPSGTRWCELRAGGNEDEVPAVQVGQVVRVHYVCRLDDGTRIAGGTASFRLGSRTGAICAALDDVVPGMHLGDMRRCRAPPQSARGRALFGAPTSEILEYDVTLTGFVSQMRIVTLDDYGAVGSDDPLEQLVDYGKRSASSLARLAGLAMARLSSKGSSGGDSK